jgi:dihydropteroate synthase
VQNTAFSTNKTLNINGRLLDLSTPSVMGILNVTPDSFYDGGRFIAEREIIDRTERMIEEGATFIDVGGYSTRPGANEISEDEEMKRSVAAIKILIKKFDNIIISIDTFRSKVADSAIQEGASIINDVSGGELDAKMFETATRLRVPYILMHMRGTPQNMTQLSNYDNIVMEVTNYFHQKLQRLNELGVKDIIIDPGFGFAKTIPQNFELLKNLDYFKMLGRPLLTGVSRKSMVWKTLKISAEEALNGTTALNTIATIKGASILRVHDVKEAMQVIKICHHLGN